MHFTHIYTECHITSTQQAGIFFVMEVRFKQGKNRLLIFLPELFSRGVLVSQYLGCWWPDDTKSQGIRNQDIDLGIREYYGICFGNIYTHNPQMHTKHIVSWHLTVCIVYSLWSFVWFPWRGISMKILRLVFVNILRENHHASVVWNWYHWVAIAYLYQPSP